jgi:hypothetical protein
MSAVIESINPFGAAPPSGGLTHSAGVAAQASTQREVAEVQAKLIMAERFPRDEKACFDRIMSAFQRPGLAEQAKYQYAKGGSSVDGPSIRSAEAIAQLWGNLEFGFRELSRARGADGVTYSEVEAFAWDIQSRTRRPIVFQVRHWRDTKKGGYPVTDERDIYELMANMAQRRVRACILAVIPGDIVDAAMREAEQTLTAKADTSPEALKKMVDAFEPFGVSKEHIETRIQRHLDAITAAQVVTLKKIYASLRDGMSKPHEWFDVEPPAEPAAPVIAELNAKARVPKPASRPAPVDQPVMSYAQVRQQLDAAKTADALDAAGDLIGAVKDEGHRAELVEIYQGLRAKIGGAE